MRKKKFPLKSCLFKRLTLDQRGFTLIEALAALFILVLCISLLSFATMQYQAIRKQTFEERQLEWHMFLNQFEYNIEGLVFVSAKPSELQFKLLDEKGQLKEMIYYERHFEVLRRRTGSGGHHPMLMKVKAINFVQNNSFIEITVTFLNKETYHAQLSIEDNLAGVQNE
ncbi:competence type IV pilus minor pilin ComGF [Carnobacterium sp. ISL-102]|uniref:competence type IV pilus minor pilin ComGF n=1 Tax=Carnobacterium sp. ISL-102 TaxID=2819142 RepID=UPI001BEAF2C6|nr:competence type IV pilus minor pilin ComGF [Carnobacterium sp. ISL-102]MBT2731294.1 prepilin-type N-terminal cleavage/methylation domain-containing protein [Carnobacterium sp. ISL-102]